MARKIKLAIILRKFLFEGPSYNGKKKQQYPVLFVGRSHEKTGACPINGASRRSVFGVPSPILQEFRAFVGEAWYFK
jgi:hypothetical protein